MEYKILKGLPKQVEEDLNELAEKHNGIVIEATQVINGHLVVIVAISKDTKQTF